MVGGAADGHGDGSEIRLQPDRAVVIVERQGVVSGPGGAEHRHPAVGVLAGGAEKQRAVLAEALHGGDGAALFALRAAGRVQIDGAGA